VHGEHWPKRLATFDRLRRLTQNAAIYSAQDAELYGFIEFSEPRWKGSAFRCAFTQVVADEQWSVAVWMTEMHAADLVAFFDEIARGTGSWSQPKLWESEDSEVGLSARPGAADGDVVIDVVMRMEPDAGPQEQPSLTVRQEDAERMTRLLRSFTGISEGRRVWHQGGDPPPWWPPEAR
jgi:hypothetical protein